MRACRFSGRLVGLVLVALLLAAHAQSPLTIADQFSTAERVKQKGWWPTKGDAPRNDFVGPAVCVQCHADVSASQKNTRMARTSLLPSDSEMLRSHDKASFSQGPYAYQLSHSVEGEVYDVTDSKQTISELLSWAFGTGNNGQSYLFEHDGSLYEAR